jgi:hypothetical protein
MTHPALVLPKVLMSPKGLEKAPKDKTVGRQRLSLKARRRVESIIVTAKFPM